MKTMNRLGMCSVIFLSALVFLISCSKPEVIKPKPTPSVTLSANPATVEAGQSATISVALTNATSWSSSTGASGNGNGSFTTGPLNKETQFTVTATGPNGGASSAITITVNFPAPTVTLTATSQSIGFREKATINWSSTNGTTFVASWGATIGASGTFTTGELLKDTTFSVTATGPGGSKKADITIKVAAADTKTVLLTSKPWSLSKSFITRANSTTEEERTVSYCMGSDTVYYRLDGKTETYQSATRTCWPSLPDKVASGTWAFANNQTQIVGSTEIVWNIIILNETTFERWAYIKDYDANNNYIGLAKVREIWVHK